ncbi:MAG TPA: flagellar filament capping protein FliD [Pseudoduganella sp.]
MKIPFSSPALDPRGTNAPTGLYTTLTKSMLTKNPGLQNIEARLQRDGARLSDLGKMAIALDQFRESMSTLSGGKPSAGAGIGSKPATFSPNATGDGKVPRDASAIVKDVKDFVSAFNTLKDKLRELNTGGGANGATITRVQEQVSNVLRGANTDALAEIGIARGDKLLVLDEAKLRASIAAEPDKVSRLFGSPGNGLAEQLASKVTLQMAKGGMLATQTAAVRGEVNKLTASKTQMTEAISRQASVLVQQYAQARMGSSTMFGLSDNPKPVSLFDMLG